MAEEEMPDTPLGSAIEYWTNDTDHSYYDEDELLELYYDISGEELDEQESEALNDLCKFYHRNKDKPLYKLLEEEVSAYPLSEVCWE